MVFSTARRVLVGARVGPVRVDGVVSSLIQGRYRIDSYLRARLEPRTPNRTGAEDFRTHDHRSLAHLVRAYSRSHGVPKPRTNRNPSQPAVSRRNDVRRMGRTRPRDVDRNDPRGP